MNRSDKNAIPTVADVEMCLAAFGREHSEIVRLEVFGSVARGEATAASDVDLVATFATAWIQSVDPFDYFEHLEILERELGAIFGRPAHLTDHSGVESNVRIGNTALARAIARDGQLVYEVNHQTEGCARTYRR